MIQRTQFSSFQVPSFQFLQFELFQFEAFLLLYLISLWFVVVFCHLLGHDRRSCPEIRKLGLKGIDVLHDAIIEDFKDVLDGKDPDFEPDSSSSSDEDGVAPTQTQREVEISEE